MRKRTAVRPLRACKFPGMTRAQYDANLAAVVAMGMGLLVMSIDDRLERALGLTAHGLPQFRDLDDSAMYRRERPTTGLREAKRRLRQSLTSF